MSIWEIVIQCFADATLEQKLPVIQLYLNFSVIFETQLNNLQSKQDFHDDWFTQVSYR